MTTVTVAGKRTQDDPRWITLTRREAGPFFYSVKTTGVFCRPTCGARLPRRENVRFHPTADEARRAGFRPCRRCRPNEERGDAALVARVCRLLEEADEAPGLEALAAAVGLSPSHLHRTFKAATGVTPKAWASARRAERLREELRSAPSVTSAFHRAGFGSSGRFYEGATRTLGMSPTTFRKGGEGTTLRWAIEPCWLGKVLVAATDVGLCALALHDDPAVLLAQLEAWFPKATLVPGDADFRAVVEQVVAFVEEPARGLDLPLDVRGTAFQQRVWQKLREIPPGERWTYSGLAAALGRPKAWRAVGAACGANKLSVVIPCHRVVRTDGSLSGYLWGLERKAKLLECERKE